MKVHWAQKWIYIPYGPAQVVLQGHLPECATGAVVQVFYIASDASASVQPPVHLSVQLLPPRCACDHTIPLVPGAQLVSVRPYRYALALKIEIATQVTEMLQSGLIHPSTSAF
jgi:hypothetical protein